MYMNRWIVFRRFLLISLARCDNGNPPTTESMHHLKTDGERIFVLNLNLFQIVALTQHTPCIRIIQIQCSKYWAVGLLFHN